MSAVAAFCSPDGGLAIVADGAKYDNNGVLLGPVNKIHSLPQGDGYFAHVGIGALGGYISEELRLRDRDFDDTLEIIGDVGRQAYNRAIREWPVTWGEPAGATVIIGGWSRARQATELYRFGVRPKPAVNQATGETITLPPFVLSPLAGTWSSTIPEPTHAETFGVAWDADQPELDRLVRIICANRAASRGSERQDHDGVYGVGCFVEAAVIVGGTLNKNWIVHEWPDQIGYPIDPSVGRPMPDFPIELPVD